MFFKKFKFTPIAYLLLYHLQTWQVETPCSKAMNNSLIFSSYLTSLWFWYDGQFSPLAWPLFCWFLWLNFCLPLYLGGVALNTLSDNLLLLSHSWQLLKFANSDDLPSLPSSYPPLIDIHYFMALKSSVFDGLYTVRLHVSPGKFKIRCSAFSLTAPLNYSMRFSYLTHQQ